MSEKKHSGENTTGVTVQIRFVPLKTGEEGEVKTATISVRVDDAMKGTPDNLRELELPMISKLELEGLTGEETEGEDTCQTPILKDQSPKSMVMCLLLTWITTGSTNITEH